jgi:hypothetical protein
MADETMTDTNTQQAPADASQPPAVDNGIPQAPPQQAPDLGRPPVATAVPAAPKPENKWAGVLKGALAGLAQGGVPGLVGGAINPTAARTALANKQEMQAQNVRRAKLDNDHYQVTMMQAQRQLELAPKTVQEKYLNEAVDQTTDLIKSQVLVPMSGAFSDKSDAIQALHQAVESAHKNGSLANFDLRPVRDENGGISYVVSQWTGALTSPLTLPAIGNGSPITIPAGTPGVKVGKLMQDYVQQSLKTQGALQVLGQKDKNNNAMEDRRDAEKEKLAKEKRAFDTARAALSAKTKAEASAGKLSATTQSMVEAAPGVIKLVDQAEKQMKTLELGPGDSRLQEFMTGKVGAPNPNFAAFRTTMGLLVTKLMRMHVGARGGQEIFKHFKGLLDEGVQSPENLTAALEEVRSYANDTAAEGKPQAAPAAASPTAPAAKTGGFNWNQYPTRNQ